MARRKGSKFFPNVKMEVNTEAKPKKLTVAQRRLDEARHQGFLEGQKTEREQWSDKLKSAYFRNHQLIKDHADKEQRRKEWFCRMIFELGRTEAKKRTDADQFGTISGTEEMQAKKEWRYYTGQIDNPWEKVEDAKR